jgi:beta-glucosidase
LTNTGDYDGAEVAQVYITCRNGQVFRPKKELKAFRKVFLKAGESCKVVIPLDDKAFRYFNTETGKFEVETANYDVMVAASVTDIKLTATIRVFGTDAPVPEQVLPAYRSGKVTNVSDEEFAALLGRPLPSDTAEGKLTVLDTVSQFYRAKGMVARWLGKCVERSIQRSRAKGDPAPNALFAYNLPIRGFCQMTQGKITRKMTQDIVHMVNGHFLTGLCRFVVHFVTGRILAAKFWKSIREPLK